LVPWVYIEPRLSHEMGKSRFYKIAFALCLLLCNSSSGKDLSGQVCTTSTSPFIPHRDLSLKYPFPLFPIAESLHCLEANHEAKLACCVRGLSDSIQCHLNQLKSKISNHPMTTQHIDKLSLRGGGFSAFIEPEPHYQLPFNMDEHSEVSSPQRALVLMDQFTPYHGGYLSHQARKLYNVTIINVLSNYMAGYLYQQEQDGDDEDIRQTLSAKIPLHAPDSDLNHVESLDPSVQSSNQSNLKPTVNEPNENSYNDYKMADISEQDLVQTKRWKDKIPFLDIVGIICESDSGLDDAERLGLALGLYPRRHNGYNRKSLHVEILVSSLFI